MAEWRVRSGMTAAQADEWKYGALYRDIERMMPISCLHPLVMWDHVEKYSL
jgi:hypothetical protein